MIKDLLPLTGNQADMVRAGSSGHVVSGWAGPGGRGQPDGQPPLPPVSRRAVEHTGQARVAARAPAVAGEPVGAQPVPVALDHKLATPVAVGALARGVVHVAGVGVANAVAEGDPFTELCRIADETRADAVVGGASAHVGHRLVGSLAVRLVRAGRWPVTVVP